MKVISHRGNIRGTISEKENRPSYIDCAIAQGFDVEVDIRYINGKFYLGHDGPEYVVNKKWIDLRKNNLWFHCKDPSSAYQLSLLSEVKYFCHTFDSHVLISNGMLWIHDLDHTTPNCIIPLLDSKSISKYAEYSGVYGICTDFPIYVKL